MVEKGKIKETNSEEGSSLSWFQLATKEFTKFITNQKVEIYWALKYLNMKNIKFGLLFVVFLASSFVIIKNISAQESPFAGKVIALDAGHGGTELGATYPPNSGNAGIVKEKDVNLAVVYTLKTKIEEAGGKVVLTRVCDETISSRKERVDWAVTQCKALTGRKCDALISVHHNGNVDATHDGTMVIYNENQDKPLAIALHNSLIKALQLPDEGYDNGGYGMTVYNHLVSALTEAFYITNEQEAQTYLNGTMKAVCSQGGLDYSVLIGDRVNKEAEALFQGLYTYLSTPTKPGRK